MTLRHAKLHIMCLSSSKHLLNQESRVTGQNVYKNCTHSHIKGFITERQDRTHGRSRAIGVRFVCGLCRPKCAPFCQNETLLCIWLNFSDSLCY